MANLDPRLILRGFDGELWADDGTFLANINTWRGQINITNSDYQPGGSALHLAIFQGYTVTLSWTEAVMDDVRFLSTVVNALKNKQQINFNFQGVLRRSDGSTGRYVFRSCVPDGPMDIANVAPGQTLDRAWSFRCNEPPDLQSLLGS